jgi:hypothetical protein
MSISHGTLKTRRARAAHILAILRAALAIARAAAQHPDDADFAARWYADCALWHWRIG